MREFYNLYKTNNDPTLLNNAAMIDNEMLESRYFSQSYSQIQTNLNSSIVSRFKQQKSIGFIVFLVYLCVMIVAYYIYWRLFLNSTRNSLWVTKSMLSIIPPDVIESTKEINEFLKKMKAFTSHN